MDYECFANLLYVRGKKAVDWKSWFKKNRLVIFIGIGCIQLLILFFQFWLRMDSAPATIDSDVSSLLITNAEETYEVEELGEEWEDQPWIVDIKGAVLKPGIYQVDETMRIYDVIQLAGGVTDNAETSSLNFSQHLEDQMMIYIPTTEEGDHRQIVVQSPEEASESANGLIDINTAEVAELTQLTGIGHKKAELIIQYRDENGLFTAVEDLMNVSGIGLKTFEGLQDKITISK